MRSSSFGTGRVFFWRREYATGTVLRPFYIRDYREKVIGAITIRENSPAPISSDAAARGQFLLQMKGYTGRRVGTTS